MRAVAVAGTRLIESLEPRTLFASFELDTPLIAVNGRTLFDVQTDAGHALYSFDGNAGTPLTTASFSAIGSAVATIGDTAYFVRQDFNNTFNFDWFLWKTDGTPEGTVSVADLATGSSSASSFVTEMVASGSRVYMSIDQFPGGGQLWVSDGTAFGTQMLHSFGGSNSGPYSLSASDFNRVYFAADQTDSFAGTTGAAQQIWRSDGSTFNTTQISSLDGPDIAEPFDAPSATLQDWNGVAVFAASETGGPVSALMTNNGFSGDRPILAANGTSPVSNVTGLEVVDTQLYFVGQYANAGQPAGLYLLDTPQGTPQLVQSINPAVGSLEIVGTANGKLIYIYGGTMFAAAGTSKAQISNAVWGSTREVATAADGVRLYTVSGANALWTTDGATTERIGAVFQDAVAGQPDGGAYFTDEQGTLRHTDGTAAGTAASVPASTRVFQISGYVWNDADSSGVRESTEKGLRGYRVFLDLDADGVYDTDEPSSLTTGTGRYTLSGLHGGKYWLQVVGVDGERASTTERYRLWLETRTNTTRRFGRTNNILFGGIVYNDANLNGTKDSREKGLSNWVVYIDIDNDGFPEIGDPHTRTDGTGRFFFTNLPAGTYRFRVYAPDFSFTVTVPQTFYRRVTLPAGGMNFKQNFGIQIFDQFTFPTFPSDTFFP